MGADTPDFSGWATKANLKCSDGRTITKDAFKHADQPTRVPLVWQHGHGEISNILGYAELEHRDEGVWCNAYFNDSEMGKIGKMAVQHGDVTSLSIYANKLVEKSKSVLHGIIREVSLVLAGANPGAFIDPATIKHDDGSYTEISDAAEIYTGEPIILHGDVDDTTAANTVEKEENVADVQHADATDTADKGDKGETVKDIFETMSDKQKDIVYYLLAQAASGAKPAAAAHSAVEDGPTGDEINEIVHSMDEKQQDVLKLLVGAAMSHAENSTDPDDAAAAAADTDNTAAHSATEEGTTTMRVFEQNNDSVQHAAGTTIGRASSGTKLSKADQLALIQKSLRHGGVESLKEFVQDYIEDGALAHGIDSIETLFPDAKNVTTTPDWLTRRTEWVARVMTGTRHVPFSRISSQTADLTLDEARAKGYVKGNFKKEQFFKIAKRKTGPTTIYKKQKLERDDVIDITDFDVIVWIKGEMRLMLEAEVARAILLGDGRAVDDEDKVNEESIRPIATDAELFVTRVYVDDQKANYSPEEALELLILNRRHYRGSGNPVFFTSETFLAQMLLVKDGVNRRIYNTPADVAAALRVSDIITVDLLDEPTTDVVGIMVNLNDYTVGADRGGDVTLFDDFDINFNALLYLIETRLSGALVKAKSAIVVLRTLPNQVLVDPQAPAYDKAANTVTVKTTAGVTYRNKATNAVLTTGSPVTLAEGDELVVVAEPTSGNYFESSANDQYSFAYGRGRVAGSLY
jgi:hypothetical protein